jgi:general stress protein YciG
VKKKGTRRKAGGFAAMDPARLREIAREGGLAAHAEGKAHQFTSEEARRAGMKGGRSVSRDRDYMAEIGRRGGRARKRKRRRRRG